MDLNIYNSIVKFLPDTLKKPIPFKNDKYAPQIEIDGKRIFYGSSWSVICYIYEAIDINSYYAYIKFLNGIEAPNILHEELEFCLFEGSKKVAACKIIEILKTSFEM